MCPKSKGSNLWLGEGNVSRTQWPKYTARKGPRLDNPSRSGGKLEAFMDLQVLCAGSYFDQCFSSKQH
jgi:hypothetical protein